MGSGRNRIIATVIAFAAAVSIHTLHAGAERKPGRIFILMVWDGLRPDSVDARYTPSLAAVAREGVLFKRHHAAFPTVTMANAAALATGAEPGVAGILGDVMDFSENFGAGARIPGLEGLLERPLDIENSQYLEALNGPRAFDGNLLGVEQIAEAVARSGGFAAIVGKRGPTFLFDDDIGGERQKKRKLDFMLVADDAVFPQTATAGIPPMPARDPHHFDSVARRDGWFAKVVEEKALPRAALLSKEGRNSIIVLWQHNPDLVQHLAGLGTKPALEALAACDRNLAALRRAITRQGVEKRTDLMVVSDHGFATIRMAISLADLLVMAGLKESRDSSDVVVAQNGGFDLVYLSKSKFKSDRERQDRAARIVDFAEAQEWCGPIFSRRSYAAEYGNAKDYLGWIPGTFSQELVGIYNKTRSPDLVISFRELSEMDNLALSGSTKPAFAIGAGGLRAVENHSDAVVHPMEGVVYSDTAEHAFTTGMGMHGAAGARELRNFCAVTGPDFRRHFIDSDPTGNTDIAPTIRKIFAESAAPGSTGRVISEALTNGTRRDVAHEVIDTAYLVLQGAEVVTTVKFSRFDGRDYLDDSKIAHVSIGPSP